MNATKIADTTETATTRFIDMLSKVDVITMARVRTEIAAVKFFVEKNSSFMRTSTNYNKDFSFVASVM